MHRLRESGLFLLLAAAAACGGPDERRGHDGTFSEALTVCPGSTTIAGVDVSHDQGTIDWTQAAAGGIAFGYAKATEGLTFTDPEFSTNWSGMQAAGIQRGAYHYFHPDDDGVAQADTFLGVVGTLGQAGDLPPMLDVEVTDGLSGSAAIQQAQAFVGEVTARTGLSTVVYVSPTFWSGLGSTTALASDPLWTADWTYSLGSCPTVDAPWTSWSFWQWSDMGSVNGISGLVDLDVFNGTAMQLAQLGGGSTAPTTTPIAQVSGNDAVTLVNWPDGHLDLFARSPAGSVLDTSTSGTNDAWASLVALGSGAACGSAAAFWGGGWTTPELFSPLDSGSTASIIWNASRGWSGLQSFGGTSLTHVSVSVGLDGRPNVFALGGDGAIWTNTFDTTTSSWAGWTSLGGAFVTGAGPITWGNGTIELFTADSGGTAWHRWTESGTASGWSDWTVLGSGIASRPVPVRWQDGQAGHAEVFARGLDGQLYHSDFSYQSDWPAFTVLSPGEQIIGEPSAIMNPSSGPEVFARDPTGRVMHLTWNGSSYSAFVALGDQIAASDPFGWTRGDGNAEVFAIDTSGRLSRTYHDPTAGWTSWSPIGTGVDPCAPALPENPDAGTAADAGHATDAGAVLDAGRETDGGTGRDAGREIDAGTASEMDAGFEGPDAGEPVEWDSGQPDAGQTMDAGEPPAAVDAGPPYVFPGESAPAVRAGCSCTGSASPDSLILLVALALMRSRKMR
jgi:lysozyme